VKNGHISEKQTHTADTGVTGIISFRMKMCN